METNMKEIKIFDNHKIPRKLRGKTIFYFCTDLVKTSQYDYKKGMQKNWEYASSKKVSASDRYMIPIRYKENNKYKKDIIYLKPTEFIMLPLKSDRVVKN